ncbi:MAG: hypothetical protein ACRCV9_16265 [Burkholderiaceae bacterium]
MSHHEITLLIIPSMPVHVAGISTPAGIKHVIVVQGQTSGAHSAPCCEEFGLATAHIPVAPGAQAEQDAQVWCDKTNKLLKNGTLRGIRACAPLRKTSLILEGALAYWQENPTPLAAAPVVKAQTQTHQHQPALV